MERRKMTVKSSVLNALQASKDSFRSGEELSNELQVSRTAVWKAIKALREEGYPIEAVTNKGYMLMSESWLITEESLQIALPPRYRKNDIIIYDTTDSTNTRAKQLALDGAEHGTIIMARQQTAGRGRLGRNFFSPREGIYMSVIIRPDFGAENALLVTSAAAVAVAEAIEEVCGISAGIKWVNDIQINNRKVCGIAAEAVTDFESGMIESLIVGIGINTTLKSFPPELLNVAGAIEGDYSKSALAATVISKLLDFTAALSRAAKNTIENQSDGETSEAGIISAAEDAFMRSYKQRSIMIGKNIKVYKGGYRKDITDESCGIPARVLDIDKRGGLVVIYTDGSRETLSTGEVSIR